MLPKVTRNLNYPIANQTRDLPACIAVSQPSAQNAVINCRKNEEKHMSDVVRGLKFHAEDGGSVFLRNVGTNLPDYTTS